MIYLIINLFLFNIFLNINYGRKNNVTLGYSYNLANMIIKYKKIFIVFDCFIYEHDKKNILSQIDFKVLKLFLITMESIIVVFKIS